MYIKPSVEGLEESPIGPFRWIGNEGKHQDCPKLTDLDSNDEELPIAARVKYCNACSDLPNDDFNISIFK